MTGTLPGNPIVILNFLINFDKGSHNSEERAFANAVTCEDDLARLQSILSTIFQVGVNLRYPSSVWVARPGIGNGAANYGFQRDSSQIYIYSTYTLLPPTLNLSYIPVMPNEVEREKALEAFRQALAGMLDWSTGQYNSGKVLIHR